MKLKDIKYLIEQAYIEVLLEADEEDGAETVTPPPTEDPNAGQETVLKDSTDTMLEKFPTLKGVLVRLMTRDFKEFVKSIEWVSPRPTTFRINLQNDQDFTLKWNGKDFLANITGKNYYLGVIDEYQQALDKLAILYQSAPLKGAGEDDGEETPDFGDEEGGEEDAAPTADLGDEKVDFEAGEEP